MANMLTCPKCRKELRTSAALAAGQRIRCPACATMFSSDGVAAPGGAVVVVDGAAGGGKSSGRLLVALGGTLAVLVLLGVGAFVWPGFLVFGRPPSQARTLLAYVPADSSIVGGAQIGLFRTDPQFRANWNAVQQKIAQLDIPDDARDLLNDADEIVVAGSSDLQTAVFVASTAQPLDADKVKRLAKAGPPQIIQGQTIFATNDLMPDKQSFLALPTDRILVLAVMSEADFVKLLAGAPTARLHADIQEQVDHAHDALVWVAARFDPTIRGQLTELRGKLVPIEPLLGPDLGMALGAVERGKGALLSVDLGERDLKLNLGAVCQDAGDAAQLKTSFGNFWNGPAKHLLVIGGTFIPGLDKLAGEVQGSFTLEQRERTVIAGLQVNQDTLKALADSIKKNGLNPLGGLGALKAPFPGMR